MRLTETEFEQWCCQLKLSEAATKEIKNIRESPPSRRVGGGKKNVSGRYPSLKMGVTIQFESHRLELPLIYQLENDKLVLEYYDQPPSFKINYESKSGRNIGYYYTPDFFIIHQDKVGWVECKREEDLEKIRELKPNLYQKNDLGKWSCPPAEKYASPLGFYFEIWTDKNINWILQRNLEFLQDFKKNNQEIFSENVTKNIKSIVKIKPGITIDELLNALPEIKCDDLYFLIVSGKIYLDLRKFALVEPQKCRLFNSKSEAESWTLIYESQARDTEIKLPLFELKEGTIVDYNGKSLTIKLVGNNQVLLEGEKGQLMEINIAQLSYFVKEGKIKYQGGNYDNENQEKIQEILLQASEKDLKIANERFNLIKPYLEDKTIPKNTPRERSLRNWLKAYSQAQLNYGYGYLGLISSNHKKGNRQRKIPLYLIEKIDKFITQEYESKKQKNKSSVYASFVKSCEDEGVALINIPSYKTFITEIKKRSTMKQIEKREGKRSAYKEEVFYWELNQTTPCHGDFPFHICHIDHTCCDIELRCSQTGLILGKPWLTILVDAFSRRILALYISYDNPSYRSCMMVLRICVQRHGRLPQIIVTDNGKEFHSTYFETLLALCQCTLKHRPCAASRFGSICERLFGTTNSQFFYNLTGNTQLTKKVRLVTSSVNPKNLAIWTLETLYLYLSEYSYNIYDTIPHPSLNGLSPSQQFLRGINQYGSRNQKLITYDKNFKILTLPTTNKGKAKVHIGKGIKINYKYYWHHIFRDPEIENTLVNIRYDPFNVAVAYAYVKNQWVECISEYYSLFKGHSEKEIQIATAQLKKQQQNYGKSYKIRAAKLGEFLNSTQLEENILTQRLKDEQTKEVLTIIDENITLNSPSTLLEKSSTDKLTNNQKQLSQNLPEIKLETLTIYEEF